MPHVHTSRAGSLGGNTMHSDIILLLIVTILAVIAAGKFVWHFLAAIILAVMLLHFFGPYPFWMIESFLR